MFWNLCKPAAHRRRSVGLACEGQQSSEEGDPSPASGSRGIPMQGASQAGLPQAGGTQLTSFNRMWWSTSWPQSNDLWAWLTAEVIAPVPPHLVMTIIVRFLRTVLTMLRMQTTPANKVCDNFVGSVRLMSCIHRCSAARAVIVNGIIGVTELWRMTRCPADSSRAPDGELDHVPQTRWSPD